MSADVSDEKAIITIEVELVSDVKGEFETTEQTEQDPFLSGIDSAEKDEIKKEILTAVDEKIDVLQESIDTAIMEEINTNIKDAIENALIEEGIDPQSLRDAAGLVKDLDNKAMGNIQNIAKNPESFMENTIISTLAKAGPYVALAAAISTAIA